MYALNALMPTSKVSQKNASEADKKEIGGFEMGTWDFPNYTRVISKALGDKWLGEEIRESDKNGRFAYSIRKVFSQEEMAKIREWLKENSALTEKNGKQWIEVQSEEIMGHGRKLSMVPKWFDRFLELFSNESDTVSFISA